MPEQGDEEPPQATPPSKTKATNSERTETITPVLRDTPGARGPRRRGEETCAVPELPAWEGLGPAQPPAACSCLPSHPRSSPPPGPESARKWLYSQIMTPLMQPLGWKLRTINPAFEEELPDRHGGGCAPCWCCEGLHCAALPDRRNVGIPLPTRITCSQHARRDRGK